MSVGLRRVVVTGMGVVCPLGAGLPGAWQAIKMGQSGMKRLPHTDDIAWKRLPSQVAASVPVHPDLHGFDPSLFSSTDDRVLSLGMKYGLVAAEEALTQAQWKPQDPDELLRTGVAIGMGMVDLDYIGACHALSQQGQSKKMGPYFVPRILPNLSAGHVSIKYGFRGPNHSVSTACATGSHAIGDAYRMIQFGSADVMVCGGVDACVNPLAMAGFCRARALSTKFNDDPEKASRPFDAGRDGFVIGEGAGVLVLEELKHAKARHVEIFGEVLGYGMSGDASHITAGREDGEGALHAMKAAFKSVGDEAMDDLWYINAHATSTPKGDLAEIKAISALLKASKARPWVGSNKGNVGHLLGAAGSVESCFALKSLSECVVPANLNIDKLDDGVKDSKLEITRETVQDANESGRRRLVLKNSFGFGGTNVSLLFGEFRN